MSNIRKSRGNLTRNALSELSRIGSRSPWSQRAKNVNPIIRAGVDLLGLGIGSTGQLVSLANRNVSKTTNRIARRAVNGLEDIGALSPQSAMKMRVAIETQAIKDGEQMWRNPHSNKPFTLRESESAPIPSDVRSRNLKRIATEIVDGQSFDSPIVERVRGRVSTAAGKLSQKLEEKSPELAGKAKTIVRNVIREGSVPIRRKKSSKEMTRAQKIKQQEEQIKFELTNPERNPMIENYAKLRTRTLATAGTAGTILSGIAWNHYNKLAQGASELSQKASDASAKKIKEVANIVSQASKEQIRQARQRVIDSVKPKTPRPRQFAFQPSKIKIGRNEVPDAVIVYTGNNAYVQAYKAKKQPQVERASAYNAVRKGMNMRKMHTPMKSVSVPYTRTLTDDSVPTPKKYMHKMMGGKTGRMGKELTGADGVKGRYFQKGQPLYKFYEVDKPHAPQMRAMGMGASMGKMQKSARNLTRLRGLFGGAKGKDMARAKDLIGSFFSNIRGNNVPVMPKSKGMNALQEAKSFLRSVTSGRRSLKNMFGFVPSGGYAAPSKYSFVQETVTRNVKSPDSPIISEAVTVSQVGNRKPKTVRYVDINTSNRNVEGAERYLQSKGKSTQGATGEVKIPINLRFPSNKAFKLPVLRSKQYYPETDMWKPILDGAPLPGQGRYTRKRATHKMHEITNENYYGNQKPRKKNTFQKSQGAFINGRKLKY